MDISLTDQLAAVTATELCVGPSGDEGIHYSVANGESLLVLLGSVVAEILSWKQKHQDLAAEHQHTKERLALATENLEAARLALEQKQKDDVARLEAKIAAMEASEKHVADPSKEQEIDEKDNDASEEMEARLKRMEDENLRLRRSVERDMEALLQRIDKGEEKQPLPETTNVECDEINESKIEPVGLDDCAKGAQVSAADDDEQVLTRLRSVENENVRLKDRIRCIEEKNLNDTAKLKTIEKISKLEARLKDIEEKPNDAELAASAKGEEEEDEDKNAIVIDRLNARIKALENQPTAAVANAQIVTTSIEEAIPKHADDEVEDVASLFEPTISGLRQNMNQLGAEVRRVSEKLQQLQSPQKLSRDIERVNRETSIQDADNVGSRFDALDAASASLRCELESLRQHVDEESQAVREYVSATMAQKSNEFCPESSTATGTTKIVVETKSNRVTSTPPRIEKEELMHQDTESPHSVARNESHGAAAPKKRLSGAEDVKLVIPTAISDASRGRLLKAEARLCIVEERLEEILQSAADNEKILRSKENGTECALAEIKLRLTSLEDARDAVVDCESHSVAAVGVENLSCAKSEASKSFVFSQRDLQNLSQSIDAVEGRRRELEKRVGALEKRSGNRKKAPNEGGCSISIEELSPLIAQYVEARLQVSEDELRGKRTNMSAIKALTTRLCQSMRRHKKGTAAARSTEFVLANFGELTDSAAKWLGSQPREEREPVKRKLQNELRRNLFVVAKEPATTAAPPTSVSPSPRPNLVQEECAESGTLATSRQLLCLSCKRPTSEQSARQSGRQLTAHRQFVGSPETAESVVWRGGFKMKFSNSFYCPPTFNEGGLDSPTRIKRETTS